MVRTDELSPEVNKKSKVEEEFNAHFHLDNVGVSFN
nr:MAG TPA: hypothetical protein [Caudoviricetes sp.]